MGLNGLLVADEDHRVWPMTPRPKSDTSSAHFHRAKRSLRSRAGRARLGWGIRRQQVQVADADRLRQLIEGDHRRIASALLQSADILLAEA